MISANKTIDLVKLRFYNDWLYNTHLYDEGPSDYHRQVTDQVIAKYIDPLQIPKHCNIIDLGCGPGYFLDNMKSKGYTNLCGVTLSMADAQQCMNNGHKVCQLDISFLPVDLGFNDNTVDFIFLRHALEHSPYPIFSLMEYNRVLRLGGYMYIEVPAPDCERGHEYNLNHYSILGHNQLKALLQRTGFEVTQFDVIEFPLTLQNNKTVKETFYCMLVKKKFDLDIK